MEQFSYVYILESELGAEYFYVGLTDDLRDRLRATTPEKSPIANDTLYELQSSIQDPGLGVPELRWIRSKASADPVCTLFADGELTGWPLSSTQTRRGILLPVSGGRLTQCPFFWGAGAAAAEPEPLDAQPPSRPSTSKRTVKERIRATFIEAQHNQTRGRRQAGETW